MDDMQSIRHCFLSAVCRFCSGYLACLRTGWKTELTSSYLVHIMHGLLGISVTQQVFIR